MVLPCPWSIRLSHYVTGPGGFPLEQITGSTVTYYTHDQLGSTRLLTNSSGATVATYTYTPYGVVASHTGTTNTSLGFAGQLTDAESGFLYLQARYYDPSTGEFLSVDPAVTLTEQPYGYADENPVNNIDPSGLWCGGFLCSLQAGAEGLTNFGAGVYNTGKGSLIDIAVDEYGAEADLGFVDKGQSDSLRDELDEVVPDLKPAFCGPGLGASYELGEGSGYALQGLTPGGQEALNTVELSARLQYWILTFHP